LEPSPTPVAETDHIGVSLAEATAIAKASLDDPDAKLRSYAPGDFGGVYQKLFGPGIPNEPPENLDWETMVWGLLFASPSTMTTIYLDLFSGEVLSVDSAPASGLPEVHKSDIVFPTPELSVANGTTLALLLTANGSDAGAIPPGKSTTIDPADFGKSPWDFSVTTERGRELLSADGLTESTVWYTTGDYPQTSHGFATRVYLSCGELTIFSGMYPSGPPPGPSYPPHDCDP